MRTAVYIYAALILMLVISWTVNLNKLIDCDFAAPYKCEIVHIVGIVPVFAPVAVWFSSDQ